MKRIALTQGQFALVDDEDYERLSRNKWCAAWAPQTQSYYAVRSARRADGKWRNVYMHRDNMDAFPGQKVDHKNHNTLDNRRDNRRIATVAENGCNRRMQSDNTSGFKGVTWHKSNKKWVAQIKVASRKKHIGLYPTPQEAALAYDAAALAIHGEFALTNKMLGLL